MQEAISRWQEENGVRLTRKKGVQPVGLNLKIHQVPCFISPASSVILAMLPHHDSH